MQSCSSLFGVFFFQNILAFYPPKFMRCYNGFIDCMELQRHACSRIEDDMIGCLKLQVDSLANIEFDTSLGFYFLKIPPLI